MPLPPSGLDVDIHGARGKDARYEPLADASVAAEPETEPTVVKPQTSWHVTHQRPGLNMQTASHVSQ